MDGASLSMRCADVSGMGEGVCRRGSECVHGVCLVSGRCAVPCVVDADCVADEVCRRAWARRGDDVAQELGACVPRIVVPATVRVSRVGMPGLLSPEVASASLPLAAGFGLRVLLPSCGAEVEAKRLSLADVAELFSLSAGVAASPPLNPMAPRGRPLTLLTPSGSTALDPGDSYLLELSSRGGGDLDVFTLQGEVGVGVLPLELFYVGVPGWTPADDVPPPEVEAALVELTRLFSGVGLTPRVIGQHVIPGALAARLAVLDEEPDGNSPEREELFALSAGLRSAALPVFFVRAMDRGALGASGGIPGPQGVMATGGSGVVVAASVIGEERLSLGRVLAHEIGHFLGLFHTSELDGSGEESLADTPICEPSRDTDADGVLSPDECAGFGTENLMFWSARGGGNALSNDQGSILRASVLLQR